MCARRLSAAGRMMSTLFLVKRGLLDAGGKVGAAVAEQKRAVVLEEALTSVGVDERHAVAVRGEVGDEQQHLLALAKRLLGERQCAVKGLLTLLNAALKPAEHLGERFLDLVERKRSGLRSQVLRLLEHVDCALVGAILLLGQKPACAIGAQQAAHLGLLRAHLLGGIGGGIEKVCSVGMPALFVMLLICIIRACTLEGAVDGLKYMFVPGWAVANGVIEEAPGFLTVLSTAGGQMFFSLSLGMGAMITYGSYLDKKENLQKNALLIIIMDTLVALMAGLCVIPGRFALDPTGNLGGPKLLFVTMQNVFSRMGGFGPIFGILFYLLVVFAAISSSISLLEVIVAHFVDKARDAGKGDKRKVYTLIAAAAVGLGCILVCADALGNSNFSPADLLGIAEPKAWAADWLDFWDAVSEGVMMPLGALLMTFMVAYEIGTDVVKDEIEQCGNKFTAFKFYNVCVRYVAPLGLLLVLYGQIKQFFF